MPRSCSWLLALCAACAGAPPPSPQAGEAAITAAEAALRANDPEQALQLVAELEPEALPRRLRDRRALVHAQALLLTGEYWDAYLITERFPDLYPHSELRAQIAEVEFQCGYALARRDHSFLFFYSDRRGARTVLEHLQVRHPDHARVPDALRLLGDMAFEAGDYDLARERYRDLMVRYQDSEWVVYARYQYAMSIVAGLQGPDYDLDQMELASRELRVFVEGKVENPEFLANARAALQRLLEWRAERHLHIAEFYDRIENPDGRRLHLEQATVEELAGTAAAARARALLAALDPPATDAGGTR